MTFRLAVAPAGAFRIGILPRNTRAGVVHVVHGQGRPGNVGCTGLFLPDHNRLSPHVFGTFRTAAVKVGRWWCPGRCCGRWRCHATVTCVGIARTANRGKVFGCNAVARIVFRLISYFSQSGDAVTTSLTARRHAIPNLVGAVVACAPTIRGIQLSSSLSRSSRSNHTRSSDSTPQSS